MLNKLFRAKTTSSWDIIEKEVVDEIIFKAENSRNRLMLELMARGGMRIGEVLKLTPELSSMATSFNVPRVSEIRSIRLLA